MTNSCEPLPARSALPWMSALLPKPSTSETRPSTDGENPRSRSPTLEWEIRLVHMETAELPTQISVSSY